jgi:flagellar assembly protein FliH
VVTKSTKPGAEVIRRSTSEVRAWQPPDVRTANEPRVANQPLRTMTAGQLDKLQQTAHDEGFEQGRREGLEYGHREGVESGRADVAERVRRLDDLMNALNKPFDALDQQVEHEIVTLVIAMVRQLLRREVKLDPAQIVGVVREALGVLPVSARNIKVVLHPEDADLVREAYAIGDHEQKWQIVEDPVIQRGGCRVQTDSSQVDATLDSRLNSLIAPLLSGERHRDSDDAPETVNDGA